MLNMTAVEIAEKLGYAYDGQNQTVITGVTCDSRTVKTGYLFVALAGEKVDGHNYVQKAYENGAVCAVVSRDMKPIGDLVMIKVTDGVKFLQELASLVRNSLKAKVVAVTGSYGKTTTKDMLNSVLFNYSTIISLGNNNNELGLPLTVCRSDETTEILVTEMGMRGLGQIDFLCRIARPDFGIITNIGTVHSELLGSQENIAKAKCELLKYIPTDGIAVLNWQDKVYLEPYLADCQGEIIWYNCAEFNQGACAINKSTNISQSQFDFVWGNYHFPVKLNVIGEHNITNSMAVIVTALKLGVSIQDIQIGLSNISISGMRLKAEKAACGAEIINDCYNANPEAMQGALQVLSMYGDKKKIAVLGDMYELGQYSINGHKKTGEQAYLLGTDVLIAVGQLAKDIAKGAASAGMEEKNIYWCADNKEAVAVLQKILDKNCVVLVKASRGMQMEEIVYEIMG